MKVTKADRLSSLQLCPVPCRQECGVVDVISPVVSSPLPTRVWGGWESVFECPFCGCRVGVVMCRPRLLTLSASCHILCLSSVASWPCDRHFSLMWPYNWPFSLVWHYNWPFSLMWPYKWPFSVVWPYNWPFSLVWPYSRLFHWCDLVTDLTQCCDLTTSLSHWCDLITGLFSKLMWPYYWPFSLIWPWKQIFSLMWPCSWPFSLMRCHEVWK